MVLVNLELSRMTFLGGARSCMLVLHSIFAINFADRSVLIHSGFKFSVLEMSKSLLHKRNLSYD